MDPAWGSALGEEYACDSLPFFLSLLNKWINLKKKKASELKIIKINKSRQGIVGGEKQIE